MKKLKMNALVGALMAVATSSVMAQSTDAQAWSGFYGEAKVGYASFMPTIGNGIGADPEGKDLFSFSNKTGVFDFIIKLLIPTNLIKIDILNGIKNPIFDF